LTPPRRLGKPPDLLERGVERRLNRLLAEPPKVFTAARVIVSITAVIVVVSGVAMRFVDHDEFANIWIGMWWALQTVTTVGYGDIVPHRLGGRLVGVVVMLDGIASLALVTAVITSTFVARATQQRARQVGKEDERSIDARLDVLERKLDAIQAALQQQQG
jgi:voltage-gated potassium channel